MRIDYTKGQKVQPYNHNTAVRVFKESDTDIAEILVGEKPGRERQDERLFFNPVGMGIQDLIVA